MGVGLGLVHCLCGLFKILNNINLSEVIRPNISNKFARTVSQNFFAMLQCIRKLFIQDIYKSKLFSWLKKMIRKFLLWKHFIGVFKNHVTFSRNSILNFAMLQTLRHHDFFILYLTRKYYCS